VSEKQPGRRGARILLYKFLAIALALVALVAGAAITLRKLPVNVPLVGMLFGASVSNADEAAIKRRLNLPPGFEINLYATGLGDARLMALTAAGDMFLSASDDGNVWFITADRDGDGRADAKTMVAKGLTDPHGLWLEGDTLYIAEQDKVSAYKADLSTGRLGGRRIILDNVPAHDGHHTRTLKKGPDGWFYLTIGSSCNVCLESHPWRAAMIRFRPGGEPEVYAAGLRNTVGFDWQPGTGDLYGVDNARDWLGDDFPPDELNLIVRGGFYGWPLYNGDNVKDPDVEAPPGSGPPSPIAPAYNFNAHVAPLSIRFLRYQRAPGLAGAALVGQHGSWNRSTKIGYRVVSLHWDEAGRISLKPFIEGFERNDDVIGRPVDVVEAADGTIYISDDHAGAVYRVRYTGN